MTASPNRNPNGFTLVELLVVIAIIGVLIGLLLPAVQMAREAARRMECTNRVKQLALACQNYHEAVKKAYPAGAFTVRASSGAKRVSGFVPLCPYLEQSALYDQIVADSYNGGFNSDAPSESYLTTPLSVFLCPSDGEGENGQGGQARSNYRMSYGDFPCHFANMTTGTTSLGAGKTEICNADRGAFAPQQWNGYKGCTDGTTNTIFFSERLVCSDAALVDEGVATDGSQLPEEYINRVYELTKGAAKPVDACMALKSKREYADCRSFHRACSGTDAGFLFCAARNFFRE